MKYFFKTQTYFDTQRAKANLITPATSRVRTITPAATVRAKSITIETATSKTIETIAAIGTATAAAKKIVEATTTATSKTSVKAASTKVISAEKR